MSPDFDLTIKENGQIVTVDYFSFDSFNDAIVNEMDSLEGLLNKYIQPGKSFVGNHITYHRTVTFIDREGTIKWNVPLNECGVLEFVRCFNTSISINYIDNNSISVDGGLYNCIYDVLLFLGEYKENEMPISEIKEFISHFTNNHGECADVDSVFDFIRTKRQWEIEDLMQCFGCDNAVITKALLVLANYISEDDKYYVYYQETEELHLKAFNVWRESGRHFGCHNNINKTIFNNWFDSCGQLYRCYETLERNLSEDAYIVESFKSNLRNNIEASYNLYSLVNKASDESIKRNLTKSDIRGKNTGTPILIKVVSYEIDNKMYPQKINQVYSMHLSVMSNIKIHNLFRYCGLYDQQISMLDPNTKQLMPLEIPYYDDGEKIVWNLNYDTATVDSYCKFYNTNDILIAPYNFQNVGLGVDLGSLFRTIYEEVNIFLAMNPLINNVFSAALGVALGKIKFKKPVDDLESRGATYPSMMIHLSSRDEWDEEELMKKYLIDNKDDLEMIMFGFHYVRSKEGKYRKHHN